MRIILPRLSLRPDQKADVRKRFPRRRACLHRSGQRLSGRGRPPLGSRANHETKFRRAGDKEGIYEKITSFRFFARFVGPAYFPPAPLSPLLFSTATLTLFSFDPAVFPVEGLIYFSAFNCFCSC